MPLAKGKSKAVVRENISEMVRAGHSQDQAIAAALSTARKMRAPGGGFPSPPGQQIEGITPPSGNLGGKVLHSGAIHSAVAGRTDHLPTSVASGSYVLPADIVSGIGESNTTAGFRVLKRIFEGTPYGAGKAPYGHKGGPYGDGSAPYNQSGGPYGAQMPSKHSAGGSTGKEVPVVLAGGEYTVPPETVRAIGGGDMDLGHKVLDSFVLQYRAKTVKTLKNLPGPKHD